MNRSNGESFLSSEQNQFKRPPRTQQLGARAAAQASLCACVVGVAYRARGGGVSMSTATRKRRRRQTYKCSSCQYYLRHRAYQRHQLLPRVYCPAHKSECSDSDSTFELSESVNDSELDASSLCDEKGSNGTDFSSTAST